MLDSEQSQQVWLREAEFHDALASHLDAAARPAAAPNFWEALVLREAGDVRGQRVLEIGCGVVNGSRSQRDVVAFKDSDACQTFDRRSNVRAVSRIRFVSCGWGTQ